MSERRAIESEVLVERSGHIGVLTLNRPKAINALTHGMVTSIQSALEDWVSDDSVHAVLLTGSGERGLCAGGDIVSLYHDAIEGDGQASAAFWADEYRLNAAIANYPKPFVAVMDGIVLGGGIGLSAHASHRIVTERSRLGLPETGIGFVPDVGGTWLLSHAPGELGTYLGLTAGSVRAGDAIALGLADYYVGSDRLAELMDSLRTTDADTAIAAVATSAPASPLLDQRAWIDAAFSAESVPAILQRLRELPDVQAQAAADAISTKSPTACAVTLESLRRSREAASLEYALAQEFRVSLRALKAPDFAEGVRAQVIDKDRNPHWTPGNFDEVDREVVASYFETLAHDELRFPEGALGAHATTQ